MDLSKTIIENEVLESKLFKEENVATEVLKRFLTSIIIAMSIEALLLVFKISMNDLLTTSQKLKIKEKIAIEQPVFEVFHLSIQQTRTYTLQQDQHLMLEEYHNSLSLQ